MKTKNLHRLTQFLVLGSIISFFTHCKDDITNTVIIIDDQDSIFYSSVIIGRQEWMTTNLQRRRYQNVEKIVTTSPATQDITSQIAPKYQWVYDGVEANTDIYGRLYTWHVAADLRNVCPPGWHVPNDAEWSELVSMEAMGGAQFCGGKMKETGTAHWIPPNEGATNESGFTALPGGYRFRYGRFSDLGVSGFWWSTSDSTESIAYGWGVSSFNSKISRFSFKKSDGLSIRCIMDN